MYICVVLKTFGHNCVVGISYYCKEIQYVRVILQDTMMATERMADVLLALNQPFYFVLFALFVTSLIHSVSVTISYDRKELLDIRTAITHLKLDEEFSFNESDRKDILQTPEQALIPVIRWRKK